MTSARTLETLIRLSTAHAKSRLSQKVEASDAEAAHEILRYALFKEVLKPQRRKKRKLNSGMAVDGSEEEDGDGSEEEDEEEPNKRMEMPNGAKSTAATSTPTRTARGGTSTGTPATVVGAQAGTNGRVQDKAKGDFGFGPVDGEDDFNMTIDDESQQNAIAPERLTLFRARLAPVWADEFPEEEAITLETIVESVNRGLEPIHGFGIEEARAAIESMPAEMMLSDGIVYRV